MAKTITNSIETTADPDDIEAAAETAIAYLRSNSRARKRTATATGTADRVRAVIATATADGAGVFSIVIKDHVEFLPNAYRGGESDKVTIRIDLDKRSAIVTAERGPAAHRSRARPDRHGRCSRARGLDDRSPRRDSSTGRLGRPQSARPLRTSRKASGAAARKADALTVARGALALASRVCDNGEPRESGSEAQS